MTATDTTPAATSEGRTPLMTLAGVSQVFHTKAGPIRAVDHVDLSINPGEVLCLVGESGSGKTTAARMLTKVDLTPAENFLPKYPHQLSGGQRQRASVARALTLDPKIIIADESTSMLDVSIRISVLAMLGRLRDDLGVGFLFITHDLAIAKYFGWHGKTAVMYLGRIVEFGPTPQIINAPTHPYTRALIEAIPEPDPDLTKTKGAGSLRSLEIPSLAHLPPGCSFHPRCPLFEDGLCDGAVPELVEIRPGQSAACHVVARDGVDALRSDEPVP